MLVLDMLDLNKLNVISFFLNNSMRSLFCYIVDWRTPSQQVDVAFYFSHSISLMIGIVNL